MATNGVAESDTNSEKANGNGHANGNGKAHVLAVALPMAPEAKYADFFVSTPSKKKGGEGSRVVSFVMSETVHRDIEVLLTHQGGKFPWETISDFMRWAAEFSLTYAARCADESKLLNSAAQRRAMTEAFMLQKQHSDFIHQMDRVEAIVNEMIGKGHKQPVVQTLLRLKKAIQEDMGDDSYWQEVYRNEFDRRFERHLARVSLKTFAAEE